MSTRSKHTVFLHPRVSSDSVNDRTQAYMEWYSKEQRIHQTLFLCCLKVIVVDLVYSELKILDSEASRQSLLQAIPAFILLSVAAVKRLVLRLPFVERLGHHMVTPPQCPVVHKGEERRC